MAWIGITDQDSGWFQPDVHPPQASVSPDAILSRGSLLLETRLSHVTSPKVIFSFRHARGAPGAFTLQALPGGDIVLVETRGDELRHAALPVGDDGRTDTVRLTCSWDAAAQSGRVALERPGTDALQIADLSPPLPLARSDLQAAMTCATRRWMDADVGFAAVSDNIQPLGPMPGLTSQVPILTPEGEKPAGRFRRGDLVLTDAGKTVPVLQVVKRTVPARGGFRPIRLRAPYFGLSRDITVAPQQRLVMSGSQVEYMFGREAVLVPAQHLLNDRSALPAQGPALVTYYHLLLAGHEAIIAAGSPVESFYIGRLRRKPDQFKSSVLAGFDRSRLPEHPKPVRPVLMPHEAVTLALSRAA